MQRYSCSRLEAQELRIRPTEDRMPPRMMVTLQESQFPRKPPRGAANTVCAGFSAELLTDMSVYINFYTFFQKLQSRYFITYYNYYEMFFLSKVKR